MVHGKRRPLSRSIEEVVSGSAELPAYKRKKRRDTERESLKGEVCREKKQKQA